MIIQLPTPSLKKRNKKSQYLFLFCLLLLFLFFRFNNIFIYLTELKEAYEGKDIHYVQYAGIGTIHRY